HPFRLVLKVKVMRKFFHIYLLIVVMGQQLPSAFSLSSETRYSGRKSMEDSMIIKGGIPVFVHPDEPQAVRRAVKDLLRDLHKVLGYTSLLTDTLTGSAIVVATGDRYSGSKPAVSGWEAHQVYKDGNRIIVNGADMRGTIYAIYT